MAAKKQINKEQIAQAALNLVAKCGMEGLNMRDVAKECGCSTQPIYLSFANADELRQAVFKLMKDMYNKYIYDEIASGRYPEYKATGMAYIRFAKEQPQLFKHLFMRNRESETTDQMATEFDREANRITSYGVSPDTAKALHLHMWVYVHGIATMFATGYLNWDWDTVSEMLTAAFVGFKAQFGVK